MAVGFVKCPTCKQKLAIFDYMAAGTLVVCANLKCGTSLRISSHKPLRVEPVPLLLQRVNHRPGEVRQAAPAQRLRLLDIHRPLQDLADELALQRVREPLHPFGKERLPGMVDPLPAAARTDSLHGQWCWRLLYRTHNPRG